VLDENLLFMDARLKRRRIDCSFERDSGCIEVGRHIVGLPNRSFMPRNDKEHYRFVGAAPSRKCFSRARQSLLATIPVVDRPVV
jgi:hypothetical protein